MSAQSTTPDTASSVSAADANTAAAAEKLVQQFQQHLADVQKHSDALQDWTSKATIPAEDKSLLEQQHKSVNDCLTSVRLGRYLDDKAHDVDRCLDELSKGLQGQRAFLSNGVPGAWPVTVPSCYKDQEFWDQVTIPLIKLESLVGIDG
jgi:hypothetical protein